MKKKKKNENSNLINDNGLIIEIIENNSFEKEKEIEFRNKNNNSFNYIDTNKPNGISKLGKFALNYLKQNNLIN